MKSEKGQGLIAFLLLVAVIVGVYVYFFGDVDFIKKWKNGNDSVSEFLGPDLVMSDGRTNQFSQKWYYVVVVTEDFLNLDTASQFVDGREKPVGNKKLLEEVNRCYYVDFNIEMFYPNLDDNKDGDFISWFYHTYTGAEYDTLYYLPSMGRSPEGQRYLCARTTNYAIDFPNDRYASPEHIVVTSVGYDGDNVVLDYWRK